MSHYSPHNKGMIHSVFCHVGRLYLLNFLLLKSTNDLFYLPKNDLVVVLRKNKRKTFSWVAVKYNQHNTQTSWEEHF